MADIFLESPRFPYCPSFGYTSDPEFRVVITRRASGVEMRNRAWTYPLGNVVCTVQRDMEEIQTLQDWWFGVGGSAVGFRVKNHAEYKSCHVQFEPLATDQPLLDLGGGVWQLIKRYLVGVDQNNDPVYQDRPIYKPVPGTVLLSGGGSLDYTTGLVTGGGGGTWGGEWDHPMRFEGGFPVELVGGQVESATFTLTELRMNGATG